ncbi:reticulon-1 isoform X2 [Copidosoma floridanum]|uniref:reticulon-1 isoform X2 n=1 Tax=Copidosoma floridanum TaxID=29053 RepID=UPI0006C94126|nr:reticulon-1 isoform X2 [Copidosoma floridanum]
MSDFLEHQQNIKLPKHDSTDDFEHLEHEVHNHHHQQQQQQHHEPLLDLSNPLASSPLMHPHNLLDGLASRADLLDMSVPTSNGAEADLLPVPATPPPSADSAKFEPGGAQQAEPNSFELEARIREQLQDAKAATMAFMESEKAPAHHFDDDDDLLGAGRPASVDSDEDEESVTRSEPSEPILKKPLAMPIEPRDDDFEEFEENGDELVQDVRSSTLPEPEKSPELDFVRDEIVVREATREIQRKPEEDDLWDVLEKPAVRLVEDEPPTKPLPPLPKGALVDQDEDELFSGGDGYADKYGRTGEFLAAESKQQFSGGETDEFESEPEPSPAKLATGAVAVRPELGDAAERKVYCAKPGNKAGLSASAIFSDIGIVAALIYWRDPKKSGIVFGASLIVLLSLAYFSLISVVAYISLLTLTFTVAFRIYKTVQQAIQKTSDGHPFKDLLELELTLPTEKVHEVADIVVASVNGALKELRRLFLVDDFVDSLKFGVLLWSLTYLGSWFNGMTLIILGVVALFTLPKVYETNKTQIDANLALLQDKINDITAKVKAALPIGGKKAEPSKEE